MKGAGLRDDLTIHSVRYGYATLLYYKTKDLRAVQKQLGHSSLNMTSLYADIILKENEEIANKILDN
jgi:integrase